MHEVGRVLTAGLTLSPREREVLAYELLESIERDKSVAPASDPLHAPVMHRRLRSRSGAFEFTYSPSTEYLDARRRRTAPLREPISSPMALALTRADRGVVFGALWSWFGPPNGRCDPWKQTISYGFDLTIDPRAEGVDLGPVELALGLSDLKGCLDADLRIARPRPHEGALVDADDVVPLDLRDRAVGYLVGFAEGYASAGPLLDFERRSPDGYGRFGVRGGKPFDEPTAPSTRATRPRLTSRRACSSSSRRRRPSS